MTSYTEMEMLNLYRNRLGLSRVLMLPADNERQPIDREFLSLLHSRYLHLLATEDPNLLPLSDLGKECRYSFLTSGTLCVEMPDRCIRPVSLRLDCWREPVYDFHRPGCALHRRQRIPLLRATVANPLVVRLADRLLVYGADRTIANPTVELMAVTPPADGSFRLSPLLLPRLIEPDNE